MISASRLLHPYRSDGVLVPLLPQCPVLIQRRCGEEAPALSNCTGRQCSHLSLCDCLSTQEAVQITSWELWFLQISSVTDREWTFTCAERVRERKAPVRHDTAIITRADPEEQRRCGLTPVWRFIYIQYSSLSNWVYEFILFIQLQTLSNAEK